MTFTTRAARIVVPLAVALVAALPRQTTAQTDSQEHFDLFNECAPMDLVVERLPDGAEYVGLDEARVQTLAESRLRAARLYDATAPTYLYVRVGVLVINNRRGANGAFSTEVSYRKRLYDSMSNRSGLAETWDVTSYGTHSGDAGYILQSVSEHLDHFVLDYLRVNEVACNRSPSPNGGTD